jgi:hypothetical protein
MISVTPYCKADKVKKTGKSPVVIYLRQSGLPRKSLNTGIYIEARHFDNASGRFRKGSGNMTKLNTRLDNIISDINNIILDNPHFNNSDVSSFYRSGSKSTLFIPFAREQLRNERKVLAYKTWKMYDYFITMIEKDYPSLTIKQVTPDWLEEFRTLIHYLHAAHTGLRGVDQREFDPDKHVNGEFIYMELSKSKRVTSDPVRIPINDYAKKLHPFIRQYPLKQSHSRISNDLKEICALVEINKHITFHCARHSFAINSLVVGVPLEVVSKWLGHTSVSTTQIYARIVDSLSGTEMKKWNTQTKSIQIEIKQSEDGIYLEYQDLSSGPYNTHDAALEMLFRFLSEKPKLDF